jgi:hypothetical protein
MPLSYFAKFVQNDVGNSFYDLDFLQFNIGYPSPSSLLEAETTGSWTYEELASSYSLPTQRTYQQLDNSLLTGWNNYQDLKEKALKYYEYNTESAAVRSYVTFQYIADGANLSQDSFTTTVSAKENSVVDVSNYDSWSTTKFEVVDNTIIYPRKDVDFNSLLKLPGNLNLFFSDLYFAGITRGYKNNIEPHQTVYELYSLYIKVAYPKLLQSFQLQFWY